MTIYQKYKQQLKIERMSDAPRKLFFRNTSNQPQQQSLAKQGNEQPNQEGNVMPTIQTKELNQLGLDAIQPGELGMQQINVLCLNGVQQFQGMLVATNYKIVFLPQRFLKEYKKDYFEVPYTFLIKVERTIDKKQNDSNQIEISSKDGRQFKYRFQREQSEDCSCLFNVINKNAFTLQKTTLFAFTYYREMQSLENDYQGWKIYNMERDFERMGIIIQQENQQQQLIGLFKYLNNEGGQICATYYNRLVVPAKVDMDCIQKTAKFRSKERIPILSYAFKVDGKIVSLWRSGQCRVGIGQIRSLEDELYLKQMSQQLIDEIDNKQEEIKLRIYDARSDVSSIGQQVNGKGFENPIYYKNCSVDFLEIGSIHKIREVQLKLLKNSYSENISFISQLEISQWYDQIVSLIQGSVRIAMTLTKEKLNVLVHCLDGSDKTPQLISLVQIMIDGYYRTIDGFMILIQKEWINNGHQFCQRSAIGNKQHNDDCRSPIFLQFLDCVYQMIQLYPLSFEFNVKLLLDLAYHHLSSLFGSFLCDSFLEIQKQKVMESTVSIWSWMLKQKDKYKNAFYLNPSSIEFEVIIPESFTGKSIKFWQEYFLNYSTEFNDVYCIHSSSTFTKDNLQEMYKSLAKENQVLRLAQIDHEKLAHLNQQKFNQLIQIIQETKNEKIIEKLESIQLT
ncbi:unnamed protein product [Paramecium sonneborni]|uniref:Myotubularin phosphatase domain-containing protein n=1 Tax=Paramecium sonneborni TaxID=65129 RepID=A0A8S1RFN8_9CILI|nr:unnamed protein product [Paramecium sonneborni]